MPLQLVAIAGSPIAMASTTGRPQPSPRVGSTKASTARYSEGSSACGTASSRSTTGGSCRHCPDAPRQDAGDDSRGEPWSGRAAGGRFLIQIAPRLIHSGAVSGASAEAAV